MIAIKMRNELTPDLLNERDFDDVVNAIQLARAQGMNFLILEKDDGYKKGFWLDNLNTLEEIDDA